MMKIKTQDLYNAELISGVLLMLSFIAAIIIANIDFLQVVYKDFVFYPITFGYGEAIYQGPLIQIVNDGLMTAFFLLLGLELKYHLVHGEFQDRKTLILPGAAAIGGVAIPAFIFLWFNFSSPDTIKGWAISIATDTAFMLGILSVFGGWASSRLRAFIVSFSLIDDAIALIILAIFYTKSTSIIAMIVSVILVALLFVCNRLKVMNSFYYLFIGIFLWIAMVEAGIHGTLCGVILALAIPVEKNGEINPSFHDLEDILRPVVYFLILPLFAFINSGISVDNVSIDLLTSPLALGIILGLFIGKPLGIFLFSYIVVKLNYSSLPHNISWSRFYAICVLGGVGFTLSLFIGDLAFEASNPNYVMRISVIIGSLLSAIVGTGSLIVLRKKEE